MKNWLGIRFLFFLMLLVGCADERPLKPILGNSARLSKKEFAGEFYFLKSVVEVRSPGAKFAMLLPGAYLKTNTLVKFQIKENTLDVVSQVRALQNLRPAEKTPILATFALRNVDVLRKQNIDGQDTHEEEETENRRPWNERDFLVLDAAADSQDEFKSDTLSATMENIRAEAGSLRFDVARQLSDGTLATERYHFLTKRPSGYTARPYPAVYQQSFGFFRTTIPGFDSYQQPSVSETQDWMNLRNLQSGVRYHIDPTFPDHLKGGVRSAIEQWNLALKRATEKTPLEPLFEATNDKRGDLRFNVIVYDDSPDSGHGILGYAPTFSDPTTGEIIKGDVFVYGGTLAWARLAEESWRKYNEITAPMVRADPISLPTAAARASTESPALSEFLKPYRDLLVSNPRLENEALAVLVRKIGQPVKLLEHSRAEFLGEYRERLTRWEAGMPALSGATAENPIALEQKIFPPLIAHELGHTLGLRHNFKGSADHRHITRGKSSTVMDYGFLASEETHEIGQYDFAAIEIGYGNRKAEQKRIKDEKFFFCSDEHIFNTKDGFCLPYDSGSTLLQILDSLFRRYLGSYQFLNLRLDRIYFDESTENYLAKIGSLLLPIRQIYDHASALVATAVGEKSEPKSDIKSVLELWRLAGARIEADANSFPDDVEELIAVAVRTDSRIPVKELVSAPTLQIDHSKRRAVIADAVAAKQLAVKMLFQIVLKKDLSLGGEALQKNLASRPDVDLTDDATNALWRRGILADRLMALSLLLSPSGDPLGVTSEKSVATTYREGLKASERDEFYQRLSSVLSNSYLDANRTHSRWLPFTPAIPNVLRRSAATWTTRDLGFYSEGSLRPAGMIDRQTPGTNLFGSSDSIFASFLISPHRAKADDPRNISIAKEALANRLTNIARDQNQIFNSMADWIRGKLASKNRDPDEAKEKERVKAREHELLEQLKTIEDIALSAESLAMPISGTKQVYRVYFDKNLASAPMVHIGGHLFRAELLRQIHLRVIAEAKKDIEKEETLPEIDRDGITLRDASYDLAASTSLVEKLDKFLSAERALLDHSYKTFQVDTKEKE